MLQAIRKQVIVQRGGAIAIAQTDLPEGSLADVIAVVENKRSWPPGFFERTYGCWAEDPFVRAPQPEQDAREQVL